MLKINMDWSHSRRIHPGICWIARDDLLKWEINSAIAASLNCVDKKEGYGSLQLVNNNIAGEDLFFRPLDFKNCARIFGFWLKIVNPPSDFEMFIRKYKTANGHFETLHFYVSDGTLYYRPRAYGGRWSNGPDEVIVANSWYWFEIQDNYPYHIFFVNGVARWYLIMSACDIRDYDKVEGFQVSGKRLGTVLLDYWRLCPRIEYPPT
jgi:hypothetical protein